MNKKINCYTLSDILLLYQSCGQEMIISKCHTIENIYNLYTLKSQTWKNQEHVVHK
jgi:hypothetical protein